MQATGDIFQSHFTLTVPHSSSLGRGKTTTELRASVAPVGREVGLAVGGGRQLVNIFHFIIDNWGELRAPTTPARGEITSLSATKMSKMSQCVSVL